MQTEHWEDFRREMAVICESFDRKHTKELDDAYWSALERMHFADFRRCSKFIREKSGQEGFDRLPKPGKFWGFIVEVRRADKPATDQVASNPVLSREAHVAQLRRMAIECAKRETMPMFKGTISRDVPDYHQEKNKQEWAEWDGSLGAMPDDYWLPRARELAKQWGHRSSNLDFGDALKKFG